MDAQARPAPATCDEIARLIDVPLLRPELTADQVSTGLDSAKRAGVSCVVLRPCDVDFAARSLAGSAVRMASACGFPHGSANTAAKLYEARDLLRRGAKEIHMVAPISKLLSREFQHVQTEFLQMSELCRKESAVLCVILETGYLSDELKIIACRTAERAEVHFVKNATGFGPEGYVLDDVRLMRHHLPEDIGVAAAGAVATLDRLLELHAAGCDRIETDAAAAILDEWKARHAAPST